MLNSHKTRVVIAVVAACGSLAMAATADAKTRRYSTTVVSSTLSTANGYPGVGGTAYASGTVDSKRLGTGALIDSVKIMGHPFQPNILHFVGTEVALFPKGTAESAFNGYARVNEDGTQDVFIDGRFVGGSGRYRDATGRYSFEGSIPRGSDVLTGASKGRISY